MGIVLGVWAAIALVATWKPLPEHGCWTPHPTHTAWVLAANGSMVPVFEVPGGTFTLHAGETYDGTRVCR